MKYLKMFFASLQMARTLDSTRIAQDSGRVTALIDELCPEGGTGRPAGAQARTGTDPRMAPEPA